MLAPGTGCDADRRMALGVVGVDVRRIARLTLDRRWSRRWSPARWRRQPTDTSGFPTAARPRRSSASACWTCPISACRRRVCVARAATCRRGAAGSTPDAPAANAAHNDRRRAAIPGFPKARHRRPRTRVTRRRSCRRRHPISDWHRRSRPRCPSLEPRSRRQRHRRLRPRPRLRPRRRRRRNPRPPSTCRSPPMRVHSHEPDRDIHVRIARSTRRSAGLAPLALALCCAVARRRRAADAGGAARQRARRVGADHRARARPVRREPGPARPLSRHRLRSPANRRARRQPRRR